MPQTRKRFTLKPLAGASSNFYSGPKLSFRPGFPLLPFPPCKTQPSRIHLHPSHHSTHPHHPSSPAPGQAVRDPDHLEQQPCRSTLPFSASASSRQPCRPTP